MVELPDDPERDLRTLLRQLNAPTLGNELLDRILARVHAEAVAGQAQTVRELNDLITTLTAESDEFDQRLAAVRAETLTGERQRIKAGLMEEFYEDDPKTDRDHGYNAGIRQALWVMESGFVAGAVLVASVDGRIDAAIEWARQNADAVDVTGLFEALGVMPGSIPVATPPDYFVITVGADGSLTTAPGPVATPAEPEWRATSSGRLLGRNPGRIERHNCGCVTGWDDAYEQCVLIQCGRHGSAASPVPAVQPETPESDVRGTAHGSGIFGGLEASSAPDPARRSPRFRNRSGQSRTPRVRGAAEQPEER